LATETLKIVVNDAEYTNIRSNQASVSLFVRTGQKLRMIMCPKGHPPEADADAYVPLTGPEARGVGVGASAGLTAALEGNTGFFIRSEEGESELIVIRGALSVRMDVV
jgi:hypothetical protein